MGGDQPGIELNPAAASRLLRALSDDPHAPESSTPAHVSIPGYTIDRPLGGGGGGSVYRAFRDGSDRPLALKVLRARAGGPEAQRAWRELEILEQLRLPALPRLIDYGTFDGHMYFVTEFIDGLTLDRHCREHDLGRRERVELLARVADAVQSLHERAIIHRDIKPSNIIVTTSQALSPGPRAPVARGAASTQAPGKEPLQSPRPGGTNEAEEASPAPGATARTPSRDSSSHPTSDIPHPTSSPMLVDLGLAIDAGASHSMTITAEGQPVGTPAFMAPEQARGERSKISTRTDVYALGATAYQILTGHTPHDVDTSIHEAVRRVAQDEPREARTLDPSLPRGLSAVLGKACAREPEKRYASAAELGEDLRRWLRGEAVTAGGLSAWGRAVRWVGRHPAVATAGACAALFAVGTMSFTYATRRAWGSVVDFSTVNPDRTVARLVSRDGRTLREWRTPVPRGITAIEMHDRPARLGGGQVALTIIETRGGEPWSKQLAMWAVPDLREPIWVAPRTAPGIEPPPSARSGATITFFASKVLVADVFPDLPGDEIIAIHNQNMRSLSCIRVYDFAGTRLYEVWHDGGIQAVTWLPTPRLIVCAGLNQEVDWSSILGTEELAPLPPPFPPGSSLAKTSLNTWPIVVFGVKPERGRIVQWLHAPDPAHLAARRAREPATRAPDAVDPDARVAFYRWIVPGVPREYFTIAFGGQDDTLWNGDSARLVLTMENGLAFSWDISADGTAQPGILADPLKALGLDPFATLRVEDRPGR